MPYVCGYYTSEERIDLHIVMEKKKEFKIYIIVPRGENCVLLNCNNMKSMQGLTPTAEILATHFQAERVRVEIWKRDHPKWCRLSVNQKRASAEQPYRPQPLYIETEPDRFQDIVDEIKGKVTGCNDLSHIALTMGSAYIPCCIISAFHPEEYEKQFIK